MSTDTDRQRGPMADLDVLAGRFEPHREHLRVDRR
jgi:hypothetical protein